MIFAAKNETMRLFSKKKYIRVRKKGLIAPIKNNMDALLIENP